MAGLLPGAQKDAGSIPGISVTGSKSLQHCKGCDCGMGEEDRRLACKLDRLGDCLVQCWGQDPGPPS